MYPEIIRVGDFTISSFGVMVAIAFLAAYWVSSLEFKRKELDEKLLSNLFIASMVGGIVGAKILFLIENVSLSEIARNPVEYIFSRGGLTFYGGFFLAAFLIWVICRLNNINTWKILDAIAPSIAIGHAIGRIGCLMVGDDYGVPTNLPWGMAFPEGLPPTTEKVHPTQIYETILLTIIFVILWRVRKKEKQDGWLFSLFLILAGTERFLIEFIRATTPSPIPGLSLAQLMALGVIVVGVVKLIQIRASKPITASEIKRSKKGLR